MSGAAALKKKAGEEGSLHAVAGRRVFDSANEKWMVKVFPGEYYLTSKTDEMIVTVLGSCVSACIRDPRAGIGGMNLGEMLKMSIDLMDGYGAKGPRGLVLIAKQLAYMERYAKGMAPDYRIIQDLYLVKNIFPEAVEVKAAELGIDIPA